VPSLLNFGKTLAATLQTAYVLLELPNGQPPAKYCRFRAVLRPEAGE
jgi:hypothetical protein